MEYEITKQDIENYLASKQDDEVVGVCMNSSACLAHNTLVWKYSLGGSDVQALCSYGWVNDQILHFPRDVEQAVETFDNLKRGDSPVTKAEFLAAWKGESK